MNPDSIEVLEHGELAPRLRGELRRLFDEEYFATFGEWEPD
ncbi:hypothetical protein [Glutamicibacter sp. NPDC087344]